LTGEYQLQIQSGSASLRPSDDAVISNGCNDAFHFWKIPDEWRATLGAGVNDSSTAAERYLFERYLDEKRRRPLPLLAAYYKVKRFIPEHIRHRINSMGVRLRHRSEFPNWPCESALLDFWCEWLRQALATVEVPDAWHVGFWPDGAKCCVVLTHDVEGPAGFERMERMADLEEQYGFRSSWNLPLVQFHIDWTRVERLRARGFEFGSHGLAHDGRLFRSVADFARLAPVLERIAREHSMRGFRAPSTLRRAEWIAGLPFDYDSSFADTDPYEPQPGGTCSLFPFQLGGLIELPYTLPQDHTMLHILRCDPLPLWQRKIKWIAAAGGMILSITHPDYIGTEAHLGRFEELLKRLSDIPHSWRALPCEVADWWRRRANMTLRLEHHAPVIAGDDSARATPVRLADQPLLARCRT
jgi:peptidoglycan/xylan/chitin deacetylase (PgdA/CDA1 family)